MLDLQLQNMKTNKKESFSYSIINNVSSLFASHIPQKIAKLVKYAMFQMWFFNYR